MFGRFLETKRGDRLIKLISGDLTVFHRFLEITRVCSSVQQGLLQRARRAGDRVSELTPVLGHQLASASRLSDHLTNGLKCFLVTASNSVEVASSLSELVEPGDTVRCQLGSDVLNIRQVVDSLIRIRLRRLR